MAKHNQKPTVSKKVAKKFAVAPADVEQNPLPADTGTVAIARKGKSEGVATGEYRVKPQMATGTNFARHYNLLHGGKLVCGVARNSVLVKRAHDAEHTRIVDLLTKAGFKITGTPVEGTRFGNCGLNELGKVLGFEPPKDIVEISPRQGRSVAPRAEKQEAVTEEDEAPVAFGKGKKAKPDPKKLSLA